MDFFAKRKLRKQLKEYLQMARHARHMREDIADPAHLQALTQAEAAVIEIRKTGSGDVEKAVQALEAAANDVYPFARKTAMMEWTETLIVALGAAMAIRAFFFQPFKIPTGSMQPTLNGITGEMQADSGMLDVQPFRFVKWLVTGTTYHTLKAEAAGELEYNTLHQTPNGWGFSIGGVTHEMPSYMFYAWMGLDQTEIRHGWAEECAKHTFYKKGDTIWAGNKIAGDHILVNKMKYNWMAPERGDISVFDTRNIADPRVRKDTFYIKRMVGLPNEKIQIQNRRLVADGKIVSEPPMFETIATDPIYSGGHDTTPGSQLETADDFIQLGADEYLMMGDNTRPNMSLDGRFFGGVPRGDFQGPAIFVYWPFREHWGIVR